MEVLSYFTLDMHSLIKQMLDFIADGRIHASKITFVILELHLSVKLTCVSLTLTHTNSNTDYALFQG